MILGLFAPKADGGRFEKHRQAAFLGPQSGYSTAFTRLTGNTHIPDVPKDAATPIAALSPVSIISLHAVLGVNQNLIPWFPHRVDRPLSLSLFNFHFLNTLQSMSSSG